MTSRIPDECWLFLLWAWSDGNDPNFLFSLCEFNCTKDSTPPTEPLVSPAGVKIGIVASPPPETADDWFRVSTGISGQSNNWLLIAEQAANTTNQKLHSVYGPETNFESDTLNYASCLCRQCYESNESIC